jgi:hypothetical protein
VFCTVITDECSDRSLTEYKAQGQSLPEASHHYNTKIVNVVRAVIDTAYPLLRLSFASSPSRQSVKVSSEGNTTLNSFA